MTHTVRLGLIGVGRWGQVYLRTILALGESYRLTHLATSHPERADALPYRVTVTPEWRRVIEADCDAVIVATPPHTHADILEACLDARKPCLIEKPLCLDGGTAERLSQRLAESPVPVLVDHTCLFQPAYHVLKQALARSGSRIHYIASERVQWGPFRAETPVLWDWAPHDISRCLDLLACRPVEVHGTGSSAEGLNAPDLVSLRLEFPQRTQAWIHVGRMAPQKRRVLHVFTDNEVYQLDELAGEPLRVCTGSFSTRTTGGLGETPDWRTIPVDTSVPVMAQVVRYFVEGLQGGDRQWFGLDLAVDVVRVLEQCERALQRERVAYKGGIS